MSFETIQLPKFLIADLFKDCLVELDSIKETANLNRPKSKPDLKGLPVQQTKTIKYLGQNKKHVIVIVNDEAEIINDSDRAFLTNVLKACSLKLADIAIINTHNQEIQYAGIKEQLDVEHLLLFDVEPASINLPFSIPHFQIQQYASCTFLTAPSLARLNQPKEESRLAKASLWTSLKQIFRVG